MRISADPWMPKYGMGFEAFVEEEDAPAVDPSVETEDWSEPLRPLPQPAKPIWFIDGVRRIDLRLLADEAGRRVPGIVGSYAVGTVRSEGRATFGESVLGRVIVLGGGFQPMPLELECGSTVLRFEAVSEPGTDPDLPLWRLQRRMRDAEAALASRTAAEEGAIVLADGPLTFHDPTTCPIVGMAKRFHQMYLDPARGELLSRLAAGERTPLFVLGHERSGVRRYAWYVRIVDMGAPWHDHTGIARCEVRATLPLEEAVAVADQITAILPLYAGRRADPRTPQNLAPVAGLETWLRHRMGDTRLVRRAVLEWLTTSEVVA